jgi:hypothetical protein
MFRLRRTSASVKPPLFHLPVLSGDCHCANFAITVFHRNICFIASSPVLYITKSKLQSSLIPSSPVLKSTPTHIRKAFYSKMTKKNLQYPSSSTLALSSKEKPSSTSTTSSSSNHHPTNHPSKSSSASTSSTGPVELDEKTGGIRISLLVKPGAKESLITDVGETYVGVAVSLTGRIHKLDSRGACLSTYP